MKLTMWAGLAMDMMAWHDRATAFTYDGMELLLEQYDEDEEFDAVGMACEWNEFGNNCDLDFDSLINDYGYYLPLQDWLDENDYTSDEYENDEDLQDEYLHDLMDELESNRTVLHVKNGNIIVSER